MYTSPVKRILKVSFIFLLITFVALLTFYLNLERQKPLKRTSGLGKGRGAWIPLDQKYFDDAKFEPGTTFYSRRGDSRQRTDANCNCRWAINVHQISSIKQKKNRIGWFKGYANGFRSSHAIHVYDLQTDRSLLNLLGRKSVRPLEFNTELVGRTVVEIKHIQGCEMCYDTGEIKFRGYNMHDYQVTHSRFRPESIPYGLEPEKKEHVIFNHIGEDLYPGGARDYLRLDVKSILEVSVKRKEKFMFFKTVGAQNWLPHVVGSCECTNKTCSNPVEAYGLGFIRRMIDMIVRHKKQAISNGNTANTDQKTQLLNLKKRIEQISSPGMRNQIREYLHDKKQQEDE